MSSDGIRGRHSLGGPNEPWWEQTVRMWRGASGAGVQGSSPAALSLALPWLPRKWAHSAATGLVHKAHPLRTPALSWVPENPGRLWCLWKYNVHDWYFRSTYGSPSPFCPPENPPTPCERLPPVSQHLLHCPATFTKTRPSRSKRGRAGVSHGSAQALGFRVQPHLKILWTSGFGCLLAGGR